MSKVIIMRGIPGSGKSHFIRRLLAQELGPNSIFEGIYSADDFWADPKTGEYRYDPKRIGEAHADCFRRFLRQITREKPYSQLFVDNTCILPYEIAPYVLAASAYGHDHEIITIYCNPAVAARRNVHRVPESVIFFMHARLMTTELPSFWKQRIIFGD